MHAKGVQIKITLLFFFFDRSGVIWICRSLHHDTPAQNALAISLCAGFSLPLSFAPLLTCFTVINTGYLYNISINDKFVGNYFMLVPLFCGHIVCSNGICVSVCDTFFSLCSEFVCRWISMRWTILLNICIKSSLRDHVHFAYQRLFDSTTSNNM